MGLQTRRRNIFKWLRNRTYTHSQEVVKDGGRASKNFGNVFVDGYMEPGTIRDIRGVLALHIFGAAHGFCF